MSPQPQPRVVTFEGAQHTFPADATDDEIRQALSGGGADKPAKAPYKSELRKIPLVGGMLGSLDENFAEPGIQMMTQGAGKILHPNAPGSTPVRQIAGGASDLIHGAARGMAPPFLLSGIGRPLSMLTGGLVGAGAQAGGEKVAHALGAPKEVADLTGDVTGALAGPLATRGLGSALRGAARLPAKSALGLNGRMEAYGADPAKAVLEETTGIRPDTIADSARAKLRGLGTELEGKATAAGASGAKLSLAAPRSIIAGKSSTAAAANSQATPRELSPMAAQLTEPAPGFAGATEYPRGAHTQISIPAGMAGNPLGIVRGPTTSKVVAEEQSPMDYLGMKRQFDKDFIRNWSPAANTKGSLGVARQAYGSMASEFNQGVPGAAPINQKIASLVPVAERARLTDMNAGMGERMLNRAARPTGGLFPLLFGYHEGGIPGALAAIGGTEGISSPEVKMIGARTLFGAGQGLGSPEAAMGSRTLPLVKKRDGSGQ